MFSTWCLLTEKLHIFACLSDPLCTDKKTLGYAVSAVKTGIKSLEADQFNITDATIKQLVHWQKICVIY